ncbi:MAG: hypothetical protein L0322_09560, partial [Chloroflexi bacterium]|nr:hypothetical protein [Chloroflexota bacterium]
MKRQSLWLLCLLSLAGYLIFPLWFPLFPYYNHSPSPDIRTFAPTLAAALAYAVLLLALFALYWLAYRRVRQEGLSPAVIGLVALLYTIPLLFTFPVNATDIYRYFIRGRITVVHQQSPFTVAADKLPDEPYLPLAGEWSGETSPYGPVWELVAAAVVSVVPDNLALALLLFKGLAVLSHLAIGGLIWLALAGRPPAERAG